MGLVISARSEPKRSNEGGLRVSRDPPIVLRQHKLLAHIRAKIRRMVDVHAYIGIPKEKIPTKGDKDKLLITPVKGSTVIFLKGRLVAAVPIIKRVRHHGCMNRKNLFPIPIGGQVINANKHPVAEGVTNPTLREILQYCPARKYREDLLMTEACFDQGGPKMLFIAKGI
tara:strand:- start:5684 stop:6193 length:510 start_codon:yes stop_codon:yes gene_type:complete